MLSRRHPAGTPTPSQHLFSPSHPRTSAKSAAYKVPYILPSYYPIRIVILSERSEPKDLSADVSTSECAVEHPMKDASPEGVSRPKDLSRTLSPLQCAVEHPMKDASPEGVSRPKDLNVHLSLLKCAVTQNATLSALECAVAKTCSRKSFRMRSSEKRWGEGYASAPFPTFSLHCLFASAFACSALTA